MACPAASSRAPELVWVPPTASRPAPTSTRPFLRAYTTITTLCSMKGMFAHGRAGHTACEACCLLGRDRRSFQALVSARHRLVVVLLLGHLLGLGLRPSRHDRNRLAPGPKQLASFPGRFSCHTSFRLPFSNVAMPTQSSPSRHHHNP